MLRLRFHPLCPAAGMKGGSATKLLLEAALTVATCRHFGTASACFAADTTVGDQLLGMLLTYDATVRRTYLAVRVCGGGVAAVLMPQLGTSTNNCAPPRAVDVCV
jgi:hypothetical protein